MYAILLEYLGKIACNFKQEVTVLNKFSYTKITSNNLKKIQLFIERHIRLKQLL
jgi:hypothetical protein